MGTKRKHHPDHYQTRPPTPPDKGLQRRETAWQHRQETPPHVAKGHGEPPYVEAGFLLEHAAVLHCAACGAETAWEAHSVLGPCAACGAHRYRVLPH